MSGAVSGGTESRYTLRVAGKGDVACVYLALPGNEELARQIWRFLAAHLQPGFRVILDDGRREETLVSGEAGS